MSAFIHGRHTADVRLVAALTAMGIPCDDKESATASVEKTRIWRLGAISNCGKYELSDLQSKWLDSRFVIENPNHPFSGAKIAMANEGAIARAIKMNGSIKTMKRGSMVAYEFVSSPPQRKALNAGITCKKTIAFLGILGFEPFEATPHYNLRSWAFPISNGQAKTLDFAMSLWRDSSFIQNHPHAPEAVGKAALLNYQYLVEQIAKDRPLVAIRKGDSIAYLHPDCSSETERKILTQFNQ